MYIICYVHWRRSALNSAGAFPENFGEFAPIHILYYKISGRDQKVGVHVHLLHPLVRRLCTFRSEGDPNMLKTMYTVLKL